MDEDRRILLVEDNEDDVLLIERALRKGGISIPIHVVWDGDEAIEYLEGNGRYRNVELYPLPTVVLLDIRLPKRSGLEVLQWLKKHETLGVIPVIMFTNSEEDVDIQQAYVLGANSYLKKPYTLSDTTLLLQTISAYWLGHNKRPTALMRQ